jgi:hypothetical protein
LYYWLISIYMDKYICYSGFFIAVGIQSNM